MKFQLPDIRFSIFVNYQLLCSMLQIDPEELREFVNSKIQTDYKKVRGDIIICKSIPTNSNGKIVRRKIENLASDVTNINIDIISKNNSN